MDEILTCTILGVASTTLSDLRSNPSGREVWTGVRVRTAEGKTRFFPGMVVEAEASLILQAALHRGEQVELWLTGKTQRAYPYGIRTAAEAWYGDDLSGHLHNLGFKFIIIGILTLPFFGMGIFSLIAAIQFFLSASSFSARRSRAVFERGSEVGVVGPVAGRSWAGQPQAA